MTFKVIVAGGRDFADHEKRYAQYANDVALGTRKLDLFLKNIKDVEIVSGCASGADTFGEEYAKLNGFPIKEFPADWDDISADNAVIKQTSSGRVYNAIAGHIRNQKMAEYADALVLFWDGKSKGSRDMLKRAEKEILKIRIVSYE